MHRKKKRQALPLSRYFNKKDKKKTNRRTLNMKLITVYVPEPKIKALDELVKSGFYPNRAEAIRNAINDLLEVHGAIPQVKISNDTIKDIQKPPTELLHYTERKAPGRK
jgi:hypothetical protein